MTKTKAETKKITETEQLSAPMGERVEAIGDFAKNLSEAAQAGSKAYVSGLTEIGSRVFDFGKQFVTETSEHASKSFKAKNLSELAEMQGDFAKYRFETAGDHIRELAELTREKADEVVAPISDLWKSKAA